MTSEQRIALLEGLLQGWIEHFGGAGDCEHEDRDGGLDCEVCGGHMESPDEPDLDPGHDPDCIQLKTCMALHGKSQRERAGGSP